MRRGSFDIGESPYICRMTEVDISDLVTLHAGHSTVGFVDFERGAPLPYGSGALISFGLLKGILTCAHVADAIHRRAEVGVRRA
jgi:hypothetical protein